LSRPRSAARVAAERELLRSLLRQGAQFPSPDVQVLESAEKLANLGLVDLQHVRKVHCASARDDDFPPPNRHCDGLIELRPEADEGGGAYRCPRCDRIVYPEAEQKQQFDSLIVHHRQAGIEALLIDRCGELAVGRIFAGGILALSVQGINAAVCLVDYCSDARWLGRGFGLNQRCIYVTVGPDVAPRMLAEDAVAHVELVDVLNDGKDLSATIIERTTGLPGLLANIDPLVYSLGARPITPELREPAEPRRVFHLCLSPEGLFIDGLLAVRAQRRASALAIMQVLMKAYAEAAASGRTVEPMHPDALADAVDPLVVGTIEDADSIARHIPRIRKSIIETVRRYTGKPIGQHDVIETVSRSGADEDAVGYRLNPRSVALGPLQL
jgi:hypothetical protein